MKLINKVANLLGVLLGLLYILNPGFGLFELIPDNIPWIGNLDEAGAVMLIIACIKNLRQGKKIK